MADTIFYCLNMSDQIGEEEENEKWNMTTDKGARILKAGGCDLYFKTED